MDEAKQDQIEKACEKFGMEKMAPLKEARPPDYLYDEIRLVVARLRRQQSEAELNPDTG